MFIRSLRRSRFRCALVTRFWCVGADESSNRHFCTITTRRLGRNLVGHLSSPRRVRRSLLSSKSPHPSQSNGEYLSATHNLGTDVISTGSRIIPNSVDSLSETKGGRSRSERSRSSSNESRICPRLRNYRWRMDRLKLSRLDVISSSCSH